MHNTAYPDIDELLSQLLQNLQVVLGKNLVGLYLYGSLVSGDFDYEISDIDLLIATAAEINKAEFAELNQLQNDFVKKHKQWNGRIEIAYLSLLALKTFKTQTSQIAIISPGEPFHYKTAGKDWLMNWYFVRESGVALFGPDPKTIITPVSPAEFKQAVVDQSKFWRKWILKTKHPRKYQAYAILTMCRALFTFKFGKQVSKKQAAVWVQKHTPQWSALIKKALLWRQDWRNQQVNNEETFPETVKFVHFMIDQIVR